MKKKFYDLHVHPGKDTKETLKTVEKLGWSGTCLVQPFNEKFAKFAQEISELKKESSLELFIGAEIGKEIKKNSRKALRHADLILVRGGESIINRTASESWEIDILCHPEKEVKKKKITHIHQKNSGLDHIMANLLSEKKIALELNFSQLLTTQGFLRTQLMGRMKQNILLARKFNVPLIITSGAEDKNFLRAPLELIAVGERLGMISKEAKDALTTIPQFVIKKSQDRKNPQVILKGLEVLDWGQQEKKPKKMQGWY